MREVGLTEKSARLQYRDQVRFNVPRAEIVAIAEDKQTLARARSAFLATIKSASGKLGVIGASGVALILGVSRSGVTGLAKKDGFQ